MSNRLRLIAAVGCLFLSSAGKSAETAVDWLMRINAASMNISYAGVFVARQDDQLEAIRVMHQSRDGMVRERLYSLSGSPREIIRDRDQIWCLLPDEKVGVHEYRQASDNSFPRIVPEGAERLSRYYAIDIGARKRVAERATQQIRVQPRDVYRYGYHLWADIDTGLLLQADLFDGNGRLVEQYQFAEVRIGVEISDADLQPMTAKADLKWFGPDSSKPAVSVTNSPWRVATLPPGFMLEQTIRRISPIHQQPVEHRVYSDGLASVSVFIERRVQNPEATPMEGLSRMGAVHAFARLMEDYQVTVIGEVPAEAVTLIANAITREP